MALDTTVPNHHARHGGFHGIGGLVAALSFTVGREGDALLAARLTAAGAGDTVVDVGCGPGVAVRHAASLGATAIGVDPAPVMLRVARLFPRSRRIRYLQGAAEVLPLHDDEASVLWTIATVHHWRDLTAGLGEVRRALAPGGRFLAIERRRGPGRGGHASHGWVDEQAEEFASLCRRYGFDDVRVESHPGGRRPALAVLARNP